MYKTILALALIATVAFAYSDAQRYFPNDDVDYVIQGKNGRPLGISLVNMDEGEYLQEPEEEYLDDDEDFEDIDSIDQDEDDKEDMIFMWNNWRSTSLTGACWRNGFSRGLAVGGVFTGCGFGYFGLGPMCYFNQCPFGYSPCGALCIPFTNKCDPQLQAVQRAIGNCVTNEVTAAGGVFGGPMMTSCSNKRSSTALAFCSTPKQEMTQARAGKLPAQRFSFAMSHGSSMAGSRGGMRTQQSSGASFASSSGGGQAQQSFSMGMSSSHSVSYLDDNSPEELQIAQNRGMPMQGMGTPITTGRDTRTQQQSSFNRPGASGFSKKVAFKSTQTTTATTGATANFATLTGLAAVALLTKYFY